MRLIETQKLPIWDEEYEKSTDALARLTELNEWFGEAYKAWRSINKLDSHWHIAQLLLDRELAERNHIERKHIDATPDEDYPRRILEAYRRDCDFRWSDSSIPETPTSNPLIIAMNEMQAQRAAVLDKAIAVLHGEEPGAE